METGWATITTKVVPASEEALWKFTREELREYAKSLGLEVGQNKRDTISHLLGSGRATLRGSLGD